MSEQVRQQFAERVLNETGYVVDFSTYSITRGRGWSKASGSCGASIMAYNKENPECKIEFLLVNQLRWYLRKTYKLIMYSECGLSYWLDMEGGQRAEEADV